MENLKFTVSVLNLNLLFIKIKKFDFTVLYEIADPIENFKYATPAR
jgi:hypothetical protein